jgi:hypothetical protein
MKSFGINDLKGKPHVYFVDQMKRPNIEDKENVVKKAKKEVKPKKIGSTAGMKKMTSYFQKITK